MKILFLCKCSPWQIGGAETISREIALALSNLGHEVTILCAKTSAQEQEYQDINGIRLICRTILPNIILQRFPNPHYMPLALASIILPFYIVDLLCRFRFDAIREDLSPIPPSGILAFVKLPCLYRYAVVHNHALDLHTWIKNYGLVYGILGYILSWSMHRGFMQYSKFTTPSAWLANQLKTEFARHQICHIKAEWIPVGFDVQKFIFDRPALNKNPTKLLTVGRLSSAKNLQVMLSALNLVIQDFPDIQLVVIGDGDQKQLLLKQVKDLKLTRHINFIGYVAHENIASYYQNADIFVIPSNNEGASLVILEAIASHLPIIASDIVANRALLSEAECLFFAPNDPHHLAQKISWAISNYPDFAIRAYIAFKNLKRFTWQEAAQQEINELR
jgi:glycosyltransferase involved in cell wall biosynthesis